MTESPPSHPAGPLPAVRAFAEAAKVELIAILRHAPANLRSAVAGLTDAQLDSLYKNWSIRQIAHHLADSHVHSYIRFKWALTEDNPTIKAYEEADWVRLDDCRLGDVAPALALLEGLHAKWVQVLLSMTADQFSRTFLHPQTGETVSLWTALNYYAWHSRHHTAQILWLRDRHGFISHIDVSDDSA